MCRFSSVVESLNRRVSILTAPGSDGNVMGVTKSFDRKVKRSTTLLTSSRFQSSDRVVEPWTQRCHGAEPRYQNCFQTMQS